MASGFKPHTDKKLDQNRVADTTVKGVVFGDALICLKKAIDRLELKAEEVSMVLMTMFGPSEVPFVHHETPTGVDIPYGAYRIEGLGKITPADNQHIVPELKLTITFEKGADEGLWKKLIEILHSELETHESIFKGQAIHVKKPEDLVVPTYIDLKKKFTLFLNDVTREEVETSVFFPITHAVKMAEAGIAGYRGVLLHGKYGTGKTLIAYETAQISVETGRTFVLCSAEMISAGIEVARFMQPATLFIEDMDSMQMGQRMLSQLRNLMSGVESKRGYDVMLILTTNLLGEIERVDRSLLRPDRIDDIIEIPPPDRATTQRIFEHQGNGWFDVRDDYTGVYDRAAGSGCTPAILVEVVKRSKIVAMRNGGVIHPATLDAQLDKMTRQIELSEPKKPIPDDSATAFCKGLKDIAYDGMI